MNEEDIVEELTEQLVPSLGGITKTSWVKGQSGNPSGKAVPVDDMDEVLKQVLGKAGARAVSQTLVDLALSGNMQAIQYIFDRLKGKPRQATESKLTVNHPLADLLNEAMYDKRLPSGSSRRALPAPTEAEVREALSEEVGSEVP